MRINAFKAIAFACCALMFTGAANAQVAPISVKFKVDGKEVHQPFKIKISLNGLVLEPKIKNGDFVFPPEFRNQEKVDVRFTSGEYDLFYEGVYVSKINGEMVFALENLPPGEDCNRTKPSPDAKPMMVYWLEFHPKAGDGTTMTVSIYENEDQPLVEPDPNQDHPPR
ncbi:MAG TPA: hypothetical protein VGX92_18635 [Pyrinomonadaceae bacterium]|jgi:hypothetical protein|nr:hypothetical protein [Pyrinomonadaceae bacterium]